MPSREKTTANRASLPLAEKMRPICLEEMVGQGDLFGTEGVVSKLIQSGCPPSLILWGPPGCGKTTIARIVASELDCPPVQISAVTSGVRELKEIVSRAKAEVSAGGRATLLFVDEIHRFNKAQQDAFLGPVEDGTLILIGATTENPSFELNSALLSRCRVLMLESLDENSLNTILDRAMGKLQEEQGGLATIFSADARTLLIERADGDARALLNDLEWLSLANMEGDRQELNVDDLATLLAKPIPRYDKSGEEHFNLISALHKSLRGSDVQAGLYWLARMLEGGEDPLYIARRLVRFATEDIGTADPQVLQLAIAARETVHFLGMPEGALALAELVIVLGAAPKSDRVYRAYSEAVDEVRRSGSLPVPPEVRNAPTKLMRELGYGKGYRSPHRDLAGMSVPFLPEKLRGVVFYTPGDIGYERELAKRISYWESLRNRSVSNSRDSDLE